MSITPEAAVKLIVLVPLAASVIYHDVRYRRIPNMLVLTALIAGLAINTVFGGWHGLGNSALGFGVAFIPMLLLHIFGAMGAGDVKLMGAVGSILGVASNASHAGPCRHDWRSACDLLTTPRQAQCLRLCTEF